jgi:transposase
MRVCFAGEQQVAELALVAATGRDGVKKLLAIVAENPAAASRPDCWALQALIAQLAALQQQIGRLESQIHAQHRATDASRWLETIPGIGVIGATAIAATVTGPKAVKSGHAALVRPRVLGQVLRAFVNRPRVCEPRLDQTHGVVPRELDG